MLSSNKDIVRIPGTADDANIKFGYGDNQPSNTHDGMFQPQMISGRAEDMRASKTMDAKDPKQGSEAKVSDGGFT